MDDLFDDDSRFCDCVLSVSHLKAESPVRRLHVLGVPSNMSFIFFGTKTRFYEPHDSNSIQCYYCSFFSSHFTPLVVVLGSLLRNILDQISSSPPLPLFPLPLFYILFFYLYARFLYSFFFYLYYTIYIVWSITNLVRPLYIYIYIHSSVSTSLYSYIRTSV